MENSVLLYQVIVIVSLIVKVIVRGRKMLKIRGRESRVYFADTQRAEGRTQQAARCALIVLIGMLVLCVRICYCSTVLLYREYGSINRESKDN